MITYKREVTKEQAEIEMTLHTLKRQVGDTRKIARDYEVEIEDKLMYQTEEDFLYDIGRYACGCCTCCGCFCDDYNNYEDEDELDDKA